MGGALAELGDGLVQLGLLLRQVLLVQSEQLLALPVLLLQAWRTVKEQPQVHTTGTHHRYHRYTPQVHTTGTRHRYTGTQVHTTEQNLRSVSTGCPETENYLSYQLQH